MEFQINKGFSANLLNSDGTPKITLTEGHWYLTLDTAEVYVAINNELKKINEANLDLTEFDEKFESIESRLAALENISNEITYNEFSQFPTIGESDHLYVALDKKSTYIWDKNAYIKVGGDPSEIEIQMIDGGSAI